MWLMLIVMLFPVMGIGLFWVLPPLVALPSYLLITGLSVVFHRAMLGSSKQHVTTGAQGMVGMEAEVLSWEGDSGEVRCHAEIWQACSGTGQTLNKGERVRVVGCDRLTLRVRALGRTAEGEVETISPHSNFDEDRFRAHQETARRKELTVRPSKMLSRAGVAVAVVLAACLTVPSYAQTGKGMMQGTKATAAEQMSTMMQDMSTLMTRMYDQLHMSQGTVSSEMRTQMADRMKRMADMMQQMSGMMGRMSGMMGQHMMMNSDMRMQMSQMREHMAEMMGGSHMKSEGGTE